MKSTDRRFVQQRAGHRCEYCHRQEQHSSRGFHIEHVIAKKHGGGDDRANLAWSCEDCNFLKGPNVAGYLVETEEIVPLFNPRRQKWSRHFRWRGAILEPKTKCGRVTIVTLELNSDEHIRTRHMLIDAGLFSPES